MSTSRLLGLWVALFAFSPVMASAQLRPSLPLRPPLPPHLPVPSGLPLPGLPSPPSVSVQVMMPPASTVPGPPPLPVPVAEQVQVDSPPRPQQPTYTSPQSMVEMHANDPAATLYQFRSSSTRMVGYGRHRYYSYRETWDDICRTPCGVPVDTDGTFQIRGLRINRSGSFVLPQAGLVSLDVAAGHSGPRVGGVLLTTFGGLALVPGIVFTAVAFGVGNSTHTGPSPGFMITGGTLLGVGAVMLASGITLLVRSVTTVRTTNGYRLADRASNLRLALRADGLHF